MNHLLLHKPRWLELKLSLTQLNNPMTRRNRVLCNQENNDLYDFMNDYSHKIKLSILHVKKDNHKFADYDTS